MKRAEFVEKRVAHWKCEIDYLVPNRSEILAQRAEWDAQAAEAAGIAWEPEAPALPERLGYGWSSELGSLYLHPAGSPGSEPWEYYYAEAVRRYNAHATARAYITRWLSPAPDSHGRAILAILDSPAE